MKAKLFRNIDLRIAMEYAVYAGMKTPRKAKKFLLGHKLSKSKLREKIRRSVITKHPDGYYTTSENLFCPYCGCENYFSINHMVEYPEMWTQEFCLRCKRFIGGIDNSPYSHVLIGLLADRDGIEL